MNTQLTTEGKCLYCEKNSNKSLFNKHLQTHLNEKIKTNKPGKSFLIKVETEKAWGPTPYFLFLWMDGDAKLSVLDDFLRDIWLECCGHMSSFTVVGNKKIKGGMWDFFITKNDELDINEKARDKLKSLWVKTYEFNVNYFLPSIVAVLKTGHYWINGVKLV